MYNSGDTLGPSTGPRRSKLTTKAAGLSQRALDHDRMPTALSPRSGGPRVRQHFRTRVRRTLRIFSFGEKSAKKQCPSTSASFSADAEEEEVPMREGKGTSAICSHNAIRVHDLFGAALLAPTPRLFPQPEEEDRHHFVHRFVAVASHTALRALPKFAALDEEVAAACC